MTTQPMDPAALNRRMIADILAAPATPPEEGGYVLRVLETTGRRSGLPRRTPVGLLRRDGKDYLVCPDRGRDWPNNLLATADAAVLVGNERRAVRARAVDGAEAADVVAAYVRSVRAPWAVRAFALPENPDQADILDRMPPIIVFRVD
ncbi:nitroreductase family deazaflavin-dependent oxidoreductase [Allokutzneria oryzae]|uniref:Nitroreductase family deazaflavin-dependent oxidoreductase n=1 Tax=Allokutzneria oryzae TaxID=1378989 RepID=A0ABV6A641_9PSEU